MQTHDDPPIPEAPAPAETAPPPAPLRGRGPRIDWLPALAAALVAGTVSWLVGERTYLLFQPSEEAASQQYAFEALNREMAVANGRNGAVVFGTLGGLLGLALGVAGGLSRRSAGGALAGGAAGLVLGAAAGALPSFAIMPWQWEHRLDDPGTLDLMTPLLVHCGLWVGLGGAAGLAYGLGRNGARPAPLFAAALGGLIGAAVGAAVYEVVGASLFPLARTSFPISESATTRLLAQLCVAGFTALGAALSLRFAPRRPGGQKAGGPQGAEALQLS